VGEIDISRELNAALRRMGWTQPRYRYFESTDGWMFGWTVEKVEDDNGREGYQSFVYQPKGPGSRSGKVGKRGLRMILKREVTHSTRKAAKARALRMVRARNEEVAQRRQEGATT
jgi:hypothetical protein